MKYRDCADILLTGAADPLTPYIYRELERSASDSTNVWVLGTGDRAGIGVDLAAGAPSLPRHMQLVVHNDMHLTAPGDIAAHCDNLLQALDKSGVPQAIVYLSTVDVYGLDKGEEIDETAAVSPRTPGATARAAVEERLRQWCGERGVVLTVLRCAPVVCTGMQGRVRRLANAIYRGSYRHVEGADGRLSVIHGHDVARAVTAAAGIAGVFNLTDGHHATYTALTEALAHRMGSKRIFTLRPGHAKVLARIGDITGLTGLTGLTTASLRERGRTLTFSSAALTAATGLQPHEVTRYLREHDYNDPDTL